jgi:SAM-dependent methyltransferase
MMINYADIFKKKISPEFNQRLNDVFGDRIKGTRGSFILSKDGDIPVVKRVPRFVKTDRYASSFTYQWKRFPQTQIDSKQGVDLTYKDLVSKLQIEPNFFRNKLVLDIGVGVGRHAEYFCKAGAHFIGIDLSESVVQAEANLREYDNGIVCQADLFNLPFNEGVFDFVYSIGVLHHTPSWQEAVKKLSLLPKRNSGIFSVWLYGLAFARRDEWIKYTSKIEKDMFFDLCSFLISAHRSAKDEQKLLTPLMEVVSRQFPFSVHHPNFARSLLALFDGYSPDFHAVLTSDDLAKQMSAQGFSVKPGEFQASCIGQRTS